MKTRTQVLLIAAGMIAALTSFMLWQARKMIGQIATIYVVITCILLAALALALLLWVIKHIHKYIHDILATGHARSVQKYELTERRERWELERDERLAAMHVLLSRVQPGTYIVRPERDIAPSQQDVLLLPQAAGSGQRSQQPAYGESSSSRVVSALPTDVTYEQVAAQIPAGHALLGVSHNSVETCDFAQLMTVWICGGSNTGKSNTVGLKIKEAIMNGRDIKIILIDPHARKEDSLYNKIRHYESRFLMPVAKDEDEILNALTWFLEEFKRRRDIGGSDTDILLVIDEVPGVLDSEEEEIPRLVKRIARICGRESRGFGMFGWFISQNAVGLAWLRNVVLTVIAHKMNMLNEARLACNEHLDVARDMENWPRGRVIVYGLNFQGIKVLQMPLFNDRAAQSQALAYELEEMPDLQQLPRAGYTGQQIIYSDSVAYDVDEEEEEEEITEEAINTAKLMDEDLREALEAWQNGARGVRPLQRALGVTYYKAQQLYQDLQHAGLITVE